MILKEKKANYLFITLLIALISLVNQPIFSSGPIGHAFFAHKFMKSVGKYTEKEKEAFIQGTLFPDIRYLAKIPREATHLHHVTLKEVISESDAFKAGFKFHNYLDQERKRYVKKTSIHEKFNDMPSSYRYTFIKLIEDEILFPKIAWKTTQDYLKRTHREQLTFNIDEGVIKQWHFLLQLYLSTKPSDRLVGLKFFNKGMLNIPSSEIAKWATTLKKTVKEEEMKSFVENMILHFQQKFDLEKKQT